MSVTIRLGGAALAAAAGLLLATPAFARGDLDWYMAGADDQQMMMVDLDATSRQDDHAWGHYVVILASSRTTDDGKAYVFMGVDSEFDCNGRQERIVSITFRSAGNSVVGKVEADDGSADWRDSPADTQSGLVLEAVCNPSRVQQRNMMEGTLTDIRSRYLNAVANQ